MSMKNSSSDTKFLKVIKKELVTKKRKLLGTDKISVLEGLKLQLFHWLLQSADTGDSIYQRMSCYYRNNSVLEQAH